MLEVIIGEFATVIGYNLDFIQRQRVFCGSLASFFFPSLPPRYGLECLFRFYSYGLENKFRLDIFKDFEHQTLLDYKEGNLYGLEKYWAFLHYYKGERNFDVCPELEKVLANFTKLEDFRTAAAQVKEKKLVRPQLLFTVIYILMVININGYILYIFVLPFIIIMYHFRARQTTTHPQNDVPLKSCIISGPSTK